MMALAVTERPAAVSNLLLDETEETRLWMMANDGGGLEREAHAGLAGACIPISILRANPTPLVIRGIKGDSFEDRGTAREIARGCKEHVSGVVRRRKRIRDELMCGSQPIHRTADECRPGDNVCTLVDTGDEACGPALLGDAIVIGETENWRAGGPGPLVSRRSGPGSSLAYEPRLLPSGHLGHGRLILGTVVNDDHLQVGNRVALILECTEAITEPSFTVPCRHDHAGARLIAPA